MRSIVLFLCLQCVVCVLLCLLNHEDLDSYVTITVSGDGQNGADIFSQ